MIPYKCPVCEGRGQVDAGFYNPGLDLNTTNPEICKPCSGTGVLWAEDKLKEAIALAGRLCPTCSGQGSIRNPRPGETLERILCRTCGGTGWLEDTGKDKPA